MSAKASLKERILAVALAVVLIASLLPVSAIRASAESSGQLTTDIETKTFRVGVATEFTFSTVANDDAGTMVKGSFVINDPSALEKLEYLESQDGNWYEFYGDFGPATGFPLIDGTSRFRATFSKAGTYSVTAQMVRVEDGSTVCSKSAQVSVPWVHGQLTTNISKKSFKLGEATEFTFTTTANDDAGTMVKGSFTFSDPSAIEKLEYLESQDGNWYEFYGDFGPATGFPLIDGTSTFRATFNKAGSYTVTAQIKRIADEKVLCETTENVTATWTAAELSTDISEKAFIYGKTTEFTYTTTANDDAGAMVKGSFSVNDPSAIEKLEYLETQDGNWHEFSGDFGPASGFPLSDATSRFRVTFNKVGDYSATVRIVSANSDQLYCEKTTSFTVGKADIEGVSIAGKNYDYNGSQFELVEITGLAEGDTVTYQVNDGLETNEMPKESAVGSYTVKVVVTRNDNYNPYVQTVESNIYLGKIDLGDLKICGLQCEYDGNPHDVVTVTGQGEYTLEYKLGEDGTWSTTIPQVTDAGSYLVTVKAVKDDNYDPINPVEVIPAGGAEYPFNVYISKAPQTVEFAETDPAPKTWSPIAANNTYTNELRGGNSVEAVVYSAEISNMTYSGQPCAEIDSALGKVTFYGAGTVTVTATKPGGNNYQDATATYTLTIERADQNEFHFAQEVPTTVTYNENGNRIELSTTGGSGSGIVTYAIEGEPENCATLSENTLKIETAGKVIVTATKAETDTYNAISDTIEITINKAEQTIAFEDTTTTTVTYGTTFVNAAHEVENAGAADGKGYAVTTAITYEVVVGQAIASVSANGELQLENDAAGTVTVKATKAGNDCYLETSAEYTVEIVAAQTPDAPYTITGDHVEGNESGWYVGNVTITPKEGYLISESNALTNNTWYAQIIVTDEGSHEKTVYLKNDDGITDAIRIPANEIRIDKTAPDQVSIQFSTSVLDTILSVGTFGFYDAPATVTVSAHDETSHVQAFEITYGDTTVTVDAEDARFQYSNEDKDASASIEIPAEFRGKVSVVAIDTAGLRTDGQEDKTVVVDEVAPGVEVSFDNENVCNNIYYNAPRTATITITEDNFFPESMEKEQKTLTDPFKQGDAYLVITVVHEDDDGNSSTKVYKSGDLSFTETSEGSGVWVGEIPFTEDGDYTFTIDYKDFSDNYDAATSHYETSFTIDQTAPKLSLAPATADYETKDFAATLTVIEHNFRASDMEIVISAKDANNDDVTLTRDYEAYLKDASNWTRNGNTCTIPLPFDVDARYDLTITYSDLASNPQEEKVHEVFVLDKAAPTNLTISYSESILDTILGIASFGFYNATATITITADDDTAGVEYLEYYFIGEDGQKLANTQTRVDLPDEGSKTSTVEFEVEAQFRAKIGFDAVDRAGWKTVLLPDKDAVDAAEIVVVDEVAPGVEVTYNNNSAQNSTYYNAPRTATITITEDNFFPESMEKEQKTLTDPFKQGDAYLVITVVRVDDDGNTTTKVYKNEDLTTPFTEKSDEAGVWEATLLFEEDGDYTFSIDYKDFSDMYDEVKSHYETSFTIDKTAPKLSFAPPTADYEKKDFSATLTVVEHNFRASDMEVVISAKDANDDDVTLTRDYEAYLKDSSNWTQNGNTYTIPLPFDVDARYDLTITYSDLAGNPQEEEVHEVFVLDKVAPENLTITYSDSVLDTILSIGTFGFYDAPATVTITADDETAGIAYLEYYFIGENGQELANTRTRVDRPDEGSKTSSVEFEVEAQFRAKIGFDAVDRAGWKTLLLPDKEAVDAAKTVVVDEVAPGVTVAYDNNSATYDTYYRASRTATITIKEGNFFTEAFDKVENLNFDPSVFVDEHLVITVTKEANDGTKRTTVLKNADLTTPFTKTGDDTWNATLLFAEDADYSWTIAYKDFSGNVAGTFKDAFTVDNLDPIIDVKHSNNDAQNNAFFKADRPVEIKITEHNFKAEDVVVTVTADRATGTVMDYAAYLTNPANWSANGDVHTASILFDTEAYYTFEISYKDMAGRENTPVHYGDAVAPTAFTIDKSAPTGGEITISGESVLASSSGLAFDTFYRNAVSVVFSANFDISGQDNVKYQKVDTLSGKPSEAGWISYAGSVAAVPSERFVLYFRAEDKAGNVSIFHSTGIVVDDKAPAGERYAPQIDIVPASPNEKGIHSANVPVSLKVVDPKYREQGEDHANGYYSGLNKVTYRIYTQDTGAEVSGTLLDLTPNNRKTDGAVFDDNGLISSWSGSITVAASTFNSNNVIVEITAVDNAGNERIATNTDVGQPIRIDITPPAISVNYDNNNGDTVFASANTDAYFNADRTATIIVTERNFDPAKVVITPTNSNGTTPVLSGWRTEQGGGNGDNTRHIATLNYVADGDYNFNISCTDQAGLANTAVTYNGLAPQRFTIDKTAPVITVTYDNNDAQNGNYYKAPRTATITINEHNFETSRITVTLTATDHGSAITAPTISGWTDNGDSHTATILYDADALYGFDIEYRDKAGNAAADYAGDSFYVDQTAPHVEITGIVDESANNDKGNFGFVLSATDTNFDVFTPVVTAVLVEDGNIITKELEVGEIKNIDDGKQLVVTNLPDDGIYRISCTVIDKAGNAFEEVTLFDKDGNEYVEARSGTDSLLTFSVNRDGSTYEVDEYTSALSEKYYVQWVTDDVAIIEINADNLTSYSITLNDKELQEGTDYEVSLEGGNGDWFKYTYRISASLFDAEGEYNLVVSSVDKAENDAFSDVKGASIHFVVDRTAPLIAISGLASNARYQTEKQTVTLIPTDDGGALKSILVLLVDDDGNTIRTLVDLQGEDFENALVENDGKITFELEEGLYQNVRIICDDYADYGSGENIIYDETFTNVSVSSSAFMIFWTNKPLRWGVIGGTGGIGIVAALLALLKKRKKVAVG